MLSTQLSNRPLQQSAYTLLVQSQTEKKLMIASSGHLNSLTQVQTAVHILCQDYCLLLHSFSSKLVKTAIVSFSLCMHTYKLCIYGDTMCTHTMLANFIFLGSLQFDLKSRSIVVFFIFRPLIQPKFAIITLADIRCESISFTLSV